MALRGPVLYVHPYNHVRDDLVPMGAVALMNRVAVPKLGRYAWELTEDEIRGAGCVALDLHWYFSIEAVGWIARDVKRLAPDVPVVLGGITASFYARHLLEVFPVDYVVQGDGEDVFPALVEALVDGREPPPLANVWTRSGPPPSRRPVSPRSYDDSDYLTLDWFPALAEWTRRRHADYAEEPFWGEMDRYHPYIPLNRGCRFPCNGCFGSYQADVFGPGQVDRSAASLARLLDGAEAHPDYRFVNLTGGTEDMARVEAYREVLGRKRALGAYVMHFCTMPSDVDLDLLFGAFERVCLDFTNPEDVPLPLRASGWTVEAAQDRILEICDRVDGMANVRAGVSFMDTEPHPFKDRLRARDWQWVQLKENSEWRLPRPNLATLPGFQHELHPDDPSGPADREVAERAAVFAEQDLPRWPIPESPRPFRHSTPQSVKDAAKAAQAEAFRGVSRGHARYLLARALSPSLHALLDRSYLVDVGGDAVTALRIDQAEIAGFVDWYRERYRTWFVTTLDAVEIVVRAQPGTPDEPCIGPPTQGEDLGVATVRPSLDGLRVAWSGELPPGTGALAIRARLRWGGDRWLDPIEHGLRLLVLPATPGPAGVYVHIGPMEARFELHRAVDPSAERPPGDEPLARFAWPVLETCPESPWDPPDAGPAGGGPAPERWEDTAVRVALRRAVDETVERALGWTEADRGGEREIRSRLVHSSGFGLQVLVLPPGDGPCAWRGRRCRLVLQEESESSGASAVGRALIHAVERALSEAESRIRP